MAKKRCRESKRKWEQEKLEEIEDLAQRHKIRQLYQKNGTAKERISTKNVNVQK